MILYQYNNYNNCILEFWTSNNNKNNIHGRKMVEI